MLHNNLMNLEGVTRPLWPKELGGERLFHKVRMESVMIKYSSVVWWVVEGEATDVDLMDRRLAEILAETGEMGGDWDECKPVHGAVSELLLHPSMTF